MENTDLSLENLDLSDNQGWHQAVALVTKNFLTSLASGNSEAIKWDGVDQLLPDLSDIKTPYDFADYLTLCVDELCDELISDIKNNEVTINIYARDVLFNSVNCLRSLGLNEYARIETLKIQNKFTELRKHKEIRLRHEFCSDRKCINRIEHVQRSVQKAYLNMMQAQSQKGQSILHAA